MKIQEFTLVNADKLARALNGVPRDDNTIIGGIGRNAYFEGEVWKRDGNELNGDEVSKLEHALLAEYDKLGGLIKRGEDKVVTGSFYDFKGKKPRTEPKIVFTYRFGNKVVDVPDGKELPGEVKAAKILKEREDEEKEKEGVERIRKARKARRVNRDK